MNETNGKGMSVVTLYAGEVGSGRELVFVTAAQTPEELDTLIRGHYRDVCMEEGIHEPPMLSRGTPHSWVAENPSIFFLYRVDYGVPVRELK